MKPTLSHPGNSSRSLYDKLPENVRKAFESHGVTAESFTSGHVPPARNESPEPCNRQERRAKEKVERPRREPVRLPDGRYKSAKGRKADIQKRQQRARERDLQHMDRLHRRMKQAGISLEAPLRCIPTAVWIMCREILADRSGQAVRLYLKREPNKVAVGCILQAALVPLEGGGYLHTWADDRSRKIAALGLALLHLSVGTLRKGPYTSIVRGFTRGAFRALLADPFEPENKPALTTLSGVHRRGGSVQNGQLGYLTALERSGFMYRQQIPPEAALPNERWGDWTSNRYWLVGSMLAHIWDGKVRGRLMKLHELGRIGADDSPVRAFGTPLLCAPDPGPAPEPPS